MAIERNSTAVATKKPTTNLDKIKNYANDPRMTDKFTQMFNDREKASQFAASIISACQSNSMLSNADPESVIQSAIVAASLNLDINSNLGFAAIVPYKDHKTGIIYGQFQIMTKGFIQLAIRSGQYRLLNVTEIYKDEFGGRNIVTGEVIINQKNGGQRDKGQIDKIVGYCCYFELVTGFQKTEYWSVEDVQNHGKRYSKSYDNAKGLWKTNFDAMAKKTVLKNTLNQWGVKSTLMQKAMTTDQAIIVNAEREEIVYADNPNTKETEIVYEEKNLLPDTENQDAFTEENFDNIPF